MAEKIFNCIICPKCCSLVWDGTRCTGAGCKRGEHFVLQELKEPRRTLTTTVKCVTNGRVTMVPVKSREPVALVETVEFVTRIKQVTLDALPPHGAEITIEGIPLIVTG